MPQICLPAAHNARGLLLNLPPPKFRGRRECRMRAAPAISCANSAKKVAHEHTGQRRTSDIPCAMALRLITSSPRRTAFLPPLRPGKSNAPRCIDASVAASGPHVFAVRSRAVRYRHYQRPPRPVPTILAIMMRPSGGTGWAKIYRGFYFCKSEIFLISGLDIDF